MAPSNQQQVECLSLAKSGILTLWVLVRVHAHCGKESFRATF